MSYAETQIEECPKLRGDNVNNCYCADACRYADIWSTAFFDHLRTGKLWPSKALQEQSVQEALAETESVVPPSSTRVTPCEGGYRTTCRVANMQLGLHATTMFTNQAANIESGI